MNSQEAHDADVIALSFAIKTILMHLPAAAHSLREAAQHFGDLALSQPLTDDQIARTQKALRALLPASPQVPG